MRTRLFGFLISFSVLFCFSTAPVVAVNSDYGVAKTGAALGYNQSTTVFSVVNQVVVGALSLLGIIFLGMMLYAGIRWMTARGNEELSSKAKDTLTAAAIGMIVVLSSYGLTNLIFKKLTGGG